MKKENHAEKEPREDLYMPVLIRVDLNETTPEELRRGVVDPLETFFVHIPKKTPIVVGTEFNIDFLMSIEELRTRIDKFEDTWLNYCTFSINLIEVTIYEGNPILLLWVFGTQ